MVKPNEFEEQKGRAEPQQATIKPMQQQVTFENVW